MENVTPMMQQYNAIKAEQRDALLFFRLGDFYELFGQDAVEASKILNITLTARSKKDNPIPMCGVPYHAAENYIAKLTRAGKKVAIAEQVSDPSLPGIVKRKIVRVITPGTTFNEQILDQKENRFVVAIFPQKDYFGLAFADLTTGEFSATEFQGKEALQMELLRLKPVEMVLRREEYEHPEWRAHLVDLWDAPLSPVDLYQDAAATLKSHFKLTSLEGFGLASWPFATQAAAVLLHYLLDTQKGTLAHVDRITSYHREDWMPMDEATLRNLELFSTLRDQDEKGTLASVIDQTQTPMGGRLLRKWLLQPLLSRIELERRHTAVENLVQNSTLRHHIQEDLVACQDMERLLGRLGAGSGSARDLLGLAHSLAYLPELLEHLELATAPLLMELKAKFHPLPKLTAILQEALVDEPPVKITEGGMIRTGFHPELDSLHELMKSGRSALRDMEIKEREATGIPSLKVKFNRVFGYTIEISSAHSSKVPAHYVRRQTLANAERYVTEELKAYEEKVLHAEERVLSLEFELFSELKERVLEQARLIKLNAQLLAELDVLTSFAQTAIQRRYTRPNFIPDAFLVKNGRHPVVESMQIHNTFVPNDTWFAREKTQLKLITGPNMSGKSTYLRQVALIALLAQVGSFVPADEVHLPVFDRIFTRVGASDNLVKGQSTFMVEMQESAYILHHATEKSLIILDEVGRGTSTYDGLSIAWSILEYLHDKVRGFTLFATHYHELIDLAEKLEFAENTHVDVEETPKGVLFLHKIMPGGIDQSYGIEVAKLAGLPAQVVDRADEILHKLETEKELERKRVPENQLDLFARTHASKEAGKITHPALERLKGLDINSLTPLEALNALNELKKLKQE